MFRAATSPIRYIDPDGMSEEDDILNSDPNGLRGNFGREMNGIIGSAQDYDQRAEQDENKNTKQNDNGVGGPIRGLTPTDRKIAAKAWKMIITGDLDGAMKYIISSYPVIFHLNNNITWIISAFSRGNFNTTSSSGNQVWSDGPHGKLLTIGTDFGRNPMHNFVAGTVDYAAIVRGAFHEYVHVLNAYSSFGRMEDNEDEFRAHYASITNPYLPSYSTDYMRFYIGVAENYYNHIPAGNKTSELQGMYNDLENNIKPKY